MPTRYDSEMVLQIVTLYGEGFSARSIAEAMGIQTRSVTRTLKREGVELRKVDPVEAGKLGGKPAHKNR